MLLVTVVHFLCGRTCQCRLLQHLPSKPLPVPLGLVHNFRALWLLVTELPLLPRSVTCGRIGARYSTWVQVQGWEVLICRGHH